MIARGVVVPAGRHSVTMDYEPRELRVGLGVSSLGALVCAGLIAVEARRRRRAAAPAGPSDAGPDDARV